jgi:hypothetical protein
MSNTRLPGVLRALLAAMALIAPLCAHASLLSPELEDKAATFLAWFILIVMPPAAVVVFWLVHILPEKIAHKKHHPQVEGITTLCLLSLVFGGLLWPIAWLWAYTKPMGYQMAYGTTKSDDYFIERAKHLESEPDAALARLELNHLRDELDYMASKRKLPLELETLRSKLAADAASVGGAA